MVKKLILFSAFFPIMAYGATAAELQAQINALLAQIQALQSQLAGGTTAGTTASAALLASGNLTLGSRGAAVMDLQKFLNANNAQVAASGAGSPGNETQYFGPATKTALAKWQAASGVSPAAGYFGPLTRSKMASLGAASEPTPVISPAPAPVPTSTEPVISPTPEPAPAPVVPSGPFESSLKIKPILGSYTLSSYGKKILTEFQLSADEKIGISRIRFKNTGTLKNIYLVGFELANSSTNEVLVKVEDPVNGYIKFNIAEDPAKLDRGLMVSGKTYNVSAIILTPAYGEEKPYVRLDIEAASDVSAFDYDNTSRTADISKNNVFPIVGAKVTAF